MLRQQEAVSTQCRLGLTGAPAREGDQRRRLGGERSDVSHGFGRCAEIQSLCAWKPGGAERFGNMAEVRYQPSEQLCARAAEKRFGREDGTAALDMRPASGGIQKDRNAPKAE